MNERFESGNLSAVDQSPAADQISAAEQLPVADQLTAADARACPRSPEYDRAIEIFARNIYDPALIGDLNALKSKHNCDINSQADVIDFANAEMAKLDPHSKLFTRAELEALSRGHESDLGGASVASSRPEAEPPFQVEEKDLGSGIAYLSISDFRSNRVLLEMSDALQKHENAEAVVLDLRNNPGGSYSNAAHTSAFFMDTGKLYSAELRLDSPLEAPQFAHGSFQLTPNVMHEARDFEAHAYLRLPDLVDVPMVVLVNEGTASSSEMMAAALRENGDAKLVGTETAGQGVGQKYFPIPSLDAILAVSSLKFRNADGQWLGNGSRNRTGLTPDMLVEQSDGAVRGSANDSQLNAAVLYLQVQIAAARKKGSAH
ncbi:MAG: S41 family peptidase [Candidatus Obscuribacterales bacterium]|jgi:hypothetical protein